MIQRKDIKDYLHLYLGCECRFSPYSEQSWIAKMTTEDLHRFGGRLDWMKPILRPLSDMTEEEWKSKMMEFSVDVVSAYNSPFTMFCDKPKHILILENRLQTNTLRFNDGMILLKMGFDLFGLIEAGLAIDLTKLNK